MEKYPRWDFVYSIREGVKEIDKYDAQNYKNIFLHLPVGRDSLTTHYFERDELSMSFLDEKKRDLQGGFLTGPAQKSSEYGTGPTQ